jgi:hypothetical protein
VPRLHSINVFTRSLPNTQISNGEWNKCVVWFVSCQQELLIGSYGRLIDCVICVISNFSHPTCSIAIQVPCFGMCDLLSISLATVSVSLALWFFIERKQSYAWFLQVCSTFQNAFMRANCVLPMHQFLFWGG